MEVKGNYNAFKGNSKIGIKTGVEKPKPLKSSTGTKLQLQNYKQEEMTAEDVLCLLDRVVKHLSDKVVKPELVAAIITLNAALKIHGEEIETNNKAKMDKYQVTIREACKNSDLDLVARLQLLEIVEMRSVKWKPNDDVSNYYKHKLHQIENGETSRTVPGNEGSQCSESVRQFFGLFEQDNAQEALEMGNTSQLGTKVFQCLKNLPSTTWNVNAPEFSPPANKNKSCPETKAVPDMKVEIGAHRRRVQIIEPEIVRKNSGKNNDRPVQTICPSGSPSGDGYSCNRLAGDYAYTVPVGNGNYLNIQGNDPELTKAANMVLRDFFSGKSSRNGSAPKQQMKYDEEFKSEQFGKNGINGIHLKYDRDALLSWSKSPYSKQVPTKWSVEWEKVKYENPALFRQIVSTKAKEVNGLCHENKPKYSSFVQSYDEENSFTNGHSKLSPKTTVYRAQHAGGDKKMDNNQNKNLLNGKPKRWDDSKEQWVEIDE